MKWQTQSGKVLKVKEMTDSHLLNTQRFMQRKVVSISRETAACASICFQGEMAQYYQDQDLKRLTDDEFAAIDVLRGLNDEVKERGLKPLEEMKCVLKKKFANT